MSNREIIHYSTRFQRWIEEREKISDPYKPTKKYSRYAHESIKPRLYGTGALEVGAEKIFQLGNLYVPSIFIILYFIFYL